MRDDLEELRSRVARVEVTIALVVAIGLSLAIALSALAIMVNVLGQQTAAVIAVAWGAIAATAALVGLIVKR